MSKELAVLSQEDIRGKIYTIRGVQVMLDSDLATLYEVKTKRLNEQVKRNKDRFPPDFLFQLTKGEVENLMSQNATSSSESSLRFQNGILEIEQIVGGRRMEANKL